MANELNKLSDKKLKALLGRESNKIEFFADGAGLSAKLSKVGGISWVFTYRLDGKKLSRLTIGRYPDMPLKQARETRDKCRNWLASGKDPKLQFNLTMQESLKPVTVKDAIEYWIDENGIGRNMADKILRIVSDKPVHKKTGELSSSDDGLCVQRYLLPKVCRCTAILLSLSGYGSFVSPPEGDPDRRWIVFVEKNING
ncbi:integrase [Xenorhabdus beddingii]|uniref:Integrase n=1 Tax=Xenorhabdus beddingii TaxID=40578 RepID=A0A1Y2SRY3_9GAMM|nr:integrase [Xenorhabdus beddingii]